MPVPRSSRFDHGKSGLRISAATTPWIAHPAEFGTGIGWIIELEAAFLGLDEHRDQALEHESAADPRTRRIVRRHAMAELADRFRNVRAEKDQLVFVGMRQAEVQVGLAESADALARIR